MRYTGLTSLLGVLLALPGFALDVTRQATWFGGHAAPTSVLTGVQSHRVTSNGVTKVQLRHLYKDDWLVTDVVGGGDWGEGIVSNMHRVSMGVSSNSFAIEDLNVASRVADARLDGLELRADLIGPAITNVLNAIPVRAPYNSYTSFSERVPALRISSGDGIGFFVLCTDGVYRDLRYATPGSGSHRYDSMFDISSLYGREFSVSYLTGKFGNLGWTASLIPSADNIDNKLSSVCGGSSYPKCYGREATVRELLFDVLVRDPSLWAHSGFDGHGRDFVDLNGLSDAMGYSDVYARMAHLAAAQLRHDYDSGPVAGLVLTNANVRLSASGMSCSLSMRGGVLYNAYIPESVSTVSLSVIPKQDMFGPRSESYHAMLRFNGDVTLSLDVPDGAMSAGPGTRKVTSGYRLVTVTRYAEHNGVYWYNMRLEELDNFTRPDFTSANNKLVSTVDSRLSSSNEAFVSAVESVNGKYLPLSGGTMTGDVTFEANGITLGSGGWIYGGGIATAGAGYQKHNLYQHWYYNRDDSSTEDPKFEIAVKGDIAATNPAFSSEVLKVGLNIDTNAVDIVANSAVVTNSLTVSTTNRIAALETATNNLSSSVSGLASSKAGKAIPSANGNLAALTADGNLEDSGIAKRNVATKNNLEGYLPLTGGLITGSLHVNESLGAGRNLYATYFSTAYDTSWGDVVPALYYSRWYYLPNGSEYPKMSDNEISVKGDISATNPTFSNEVLKVGLNIATNSVAALQAGADTFGSFPIKGTATTVGVILAALAAAIAWLNKNKADKSELDKLAEKLGTANSALEEVV